MSETFGQGNTAFYTNTERILEAKILNAIAAGGGGGGAGGGAGGVYRGVGNPNGVVTAAQSASLYYDENSGAIWQFSGGPGSNVGWVNLIAP